MFIHIIIALIALGLLLYLVKMLPIDDWIKQIITVIAILAVIVWLMRLSGVFAGF